MTLSQSLLSPIRLKIVGSSSENLHLPCWLSHSILLSTHQAWQPDSAALHHCLLKYRGQFCPNKSQKKHLMSQKGHAEASCGIPPFLADRQKGTSKPQRITLAQ